MATTIEIAGKQQEIKFGLKALADLNKRHTMAIEGISLPMGLRQSLMFVEAGDLVELAYLLQLGTGLSEKKIEEFLESDEDAVDLTYAAITESLESGNLTRKTFKEIKEAMNQAK